MSKKLRINLLFWLTLSAVCPLAFAPHFVSAEKQSVAESATTVPQNAKRGFDAIHFLITTYRGEHNGQFPNGLQEVIDALLSSKRPAEDVKRIQDKFSLLVNPDAELSDDPITKHYAKLVQSYTLLWARPDGGQFLAPRPENTMDVQAYTEIYLRHQIGKIKQQGVTCEAFMVGYYLLDTNGIVRFVPADETYLYRKPNTGLFRAFLGQAGIPFEAMSQTESFLRVPNKSERVFYKPEASKDEYISDNGGPESLVHLSRRLNFPNRYGLDREKLWQTFDPAQAEFNLNQIQAGAQKLGLPAEVKKVGLTELEGTPALLFLKDDGRIVTLTALDDDRAVVIDRGVTRIVPREVLGKRYGGEALVPSQGKISLVAQDAVRAVSLKSYEDEVQQSVTLHNTSAKPVTLQLDYPLLGVTEAKLSQQTLAPGETATLDLKMKWRTVLPTPTQNVLVSLSTGEGQPRLQLAFLLVPPAGVKPPQPPLGPAEAAQLPRAEDDPNNQIGQAKPTVQVGNTAPDFTVRDMNGKQWKLSELKGKKNLLLTFFPKCFTGGCANHLSSLRDHQKELDAADTQILAVSVDPADGERGQLAFAKQWQLGFPLIPDTARSLSKLFGAAQNDKQLAARMSLFIDKTGLVRWVDTDVHVATHGADVLAKMKELGLAP